MRGRDERKVSVMGEVNVQAPILMRNGNLSLNEALNEAGGVNLNLANPRQIYVIRNEPTGGQAIFHLDARTPTGDGTGISLRLAEDVTIDDVRGPDPVEHLLAGSSADYRAARERTARWLYAVR